MKKLGKLSLKEMHENMFLITLDLQILIKGGTNPVNLNGSNQVVGMLLMDMMKDYRANYGSYDNLNQLVDYSTGNFGNNGGYICMQGTFSYQGFTYSYYVDKPAENYRSICGPSNGYTGSGGSGYGNFTVESCHQGRNVIVISTTSQSAYNAMYGYFGN